MPIPYTQLKTGLISSLQFFHRAPRRHLSYRTECQQPADKRRQTRQRGFDSDGPKLSPRAFERSLLEKQKIGYSAEDGADHRVDQQRSGRKRARHGRSEPFERPRDAFAHGRNPKMDRDQWKKDEEQKDSYGVDGGRGPCPGLRFGGERFREECLVD